MFQKNLSHLYAVYCNEQTSNNFKDLIKVDYEHNNRIIGQLNTAAFLSFVVIRAFHVNALPVNPCLPYLVVYAKLNSVGHIFDRSHSHESTRLARSDNSIPRSVNLLLISFFIF